MKALAAVRLGTLAVLLSGALQADAYSRDEWREQVQVFAQQPPERQIQAVTDWVHMRLRYVDDPADVWESPLDALSSGTGDCEDFAFAKYAMLRQLGWKPPQVRLAHGYTTATGVRQAHLVVLVDTADPSNPLVLDNLGDLPVPLSRRADLTLTFNFSEQTIWADVEHTQVHGPATLLRRWVTLVERMRVEGSLPAP